MKSFLIVLMFVFGVSTSHATIFTLNEGSFLGGGSDPDIPIGEVVIQLTNGSSGDVNFGINTNGLTAGLGIVNVYFTLDFDVNDDSLGGLGLPLISQLDPSGAFSSYAVDEGAFDPIAGIEADAVLRLDALNQGEFFGGVFQRFNIPPSDDDLTVGNFTQVAIQVSGEGYFADPIPVPVPVPATVWLIGSGLLGLVGMARRKKA
jgi:hypothetical protein